MINGLKWYYRLKPQTDVNNKTKMGLFSDNPRHTLTNSLIVALSYYDKEVDKEFRLYTVFKSYLEFGIYQLKLPQKERCFYEIILGESSQKPHFDIDIDDNNVQGDLVKDNLVESIIKVLHDKGTEIKLNTDVLVYTSHSSDNNSNNVNENENNSCKQSYHVVINNHCHTNNVEARAFYDNVMDVVNPEYAKWIDSAVYNSCQQFRAVGSQKLDSTRIKTFNKVWFYKGNEIRYKYPEEPDSPEHEMVMQLEASMVGFTGNCRYLPPFEPRIDKNKTFIESEDIDIKDATQAINLVAIAGKITVNDSRFPYKFLGINGPIVMLKRTRASCCKICNRVHENENPYLLVIGEEKNVYFCCRRAADNKKLFLGKLNPIENSDNKDNKEQNQPSDNEVKINNVKINWTKNVLDRVQKVAKTGTGKEKKFINPNTEIDPEHKKQFIEMFVNSK